MSNARAKAATPTWGVALAALAALLIGFFSVWYFGLQAERARWSSSYTRFEPVAISFDTHSISARIAVRTSDADLAWTTQNRDAIQVAFQQALLELDPVQVVNSPGILQAFQDGLLARMQEILRTDKIQQVVLTDFLISEH